MALAGDENADGVEAEPPRLRTMRWRWRVLLALVALILAVLAAAWFSRERIADNVIGGMLEDYGLAAEYEIESIGPERQVLRNVVIGDPLLPDLVVERLTVNMRYGFGTPTIGRVVLERPRLFGRLRDGELSFGSLDRVLFRDTGEPPGLPDLDLKLVDGRAFLETDFGPVGIKAEGEGELDGGFAGIVAATAPRLAGAGCAARGATLYGWITTSAGKPRFAGPVRLGALACPENGLRLSDAWMEIDAAADASLADYEWTAKLASGPATLSGLAADGVNGTLRATWREGRLTSRYTLVGRGVEHPQAQFAVLTAKGLLRARGAFDEFETDAEVEGNGLRMGSAFAGQISGLAEAGRDTLLAPLLQRFAGALQREARGSRLAGNLRLRKDGGAFSAVVPNAALRGGSGSTLLALSRVYFSSPAEGAPRLTGNFSTGGEGMPRIVGRMERLPDRDAVLRMRMADYAAGDSRLAIPELVLAQGEGGSLGFSGRAIVSGALPGGSARELVVPVDGHWSDGGGLALWRDCTEFRFDRLELANLALERRGLTLCPRRGAPILAYGAGGLRLAAGAPSLDIAGELAGTPIALRTGPVGFAYPGNLSVRDVTVALGPDREANRFRVSDIQATLGSDIAGTFADADVELFAVPMDLRQTAGEWRYAGGVFAIEGGSFILQDRSDADRFNPLIARGATLTLTDNVIRADALLREPTSGREVTEVAIVHDLSSGTGHADLAVRGLLFDEALQPDMLSTLALGVIANAQGRVTGTGRIDWNERGVTSSGEFSSESLDFAAAFGPVTGASGTVVFTDLINLTTAPGQTLRVGSVNPGIEVLDGEVEFALREGQFLSVAGGTWPFMGGTLTLRPVDLNLSASEQRSYIFEITGLDAATFVQQLELGNINATGTFDGEVPILFDAQGNGRIEGGRLISRPPGGNLSYVGELTYEDLSPIANYAFDALRSLDYRRMTIDMNGSLSGEIITEVRFEGVSQGEGASENFVTRQIAGLPLEFRVNIRAAFAQLITNLRSLYDPAFVRDPRELGLLSDDGTRLQRGASPPVEAIRPEDLIPDQPPVQIQESETMP